MQKFLEIGKIVTVHGLKGELKVQPWCDSPEYLCGFKRLYSAEGSTVYEVERARVQGSMVLLKLRGCDTPESAHAMINRILYLDRADAKLPEGSYFVADLLGLSVFDEQGKLYGKISDVLQTGANDVYEIKNDNNKSYYIPAIPSVILSTDIEGGKMTIYPMEGLFDED